jgi:hypothetical protein
MSTTKKFLPFVTDVMVFNGRYDKYTLASLKKRRGKLFSEPFGRVW